MRIIERRSLGWAMLLTLSLVVEISLGVGDFDALKVDWSAVPDEDQADPPETGAAFYVDKLGLVKSDTFRMTAHD
jgi:hypothetical protein